MKSNGIAHLLSEIKTQVRTAEDAVTVAEAEVARLNARLVERENGEGCGGPGVTRLSTSSTSSTRHFPKR